MPLRLTLQRIDRHLRLHILQPQHIHLAADHIHRLQHILAFRNDHRPLIRPLALHHLQHAPIRSLVVGPHIKRVAYIELAEPAVDPIHQRHNRRIRNSQVLDQNVFARRRHASADPEHKIMSVRRGTHTDAVNLAQLLPAILLAQDHRIALKRRSELVIENAVPLMRKQLRVVHPRLIRS